MLLLAKEDDQITEQTYIVLVILSAADPNPATQDEDYILIGTDNAVLLPFRPEEQTIGIPIDLLADTLPELNEGIILTSSPDDSPIPESGDVPPAYLPPISLFANTLVEIADDDREFSLYCFVK